MTLILILILISILVLLYLGVSHIANPLSPNLSPKLPISNLAMSRRRTSYSEPMNEALAYPFTPSQPGPRRGPIEGPNGRRLIRRVTWRSSTYKLMASLWVFGVLYILWLIRDLFYTPAGASPNEE